MTSLPTIKISCTVRIMIPKIVSNCSILITIPNPINTSSNTFKIVLLLFVTVYPLSINRIYVNVIHCKYTKYPYTPYM